MCIINFFLGTVHWFQFFLAREELVSFGIVLYRYTMQILSVYSMSTQCLLSIYSASTQHLLSIYSASTQHLLSIYSASTQHLLSIVLNHLLLVSPTSSVDPVPLGLPKIHVQKLSTCCWLIIATFNSCLYIPWLVPNNYGFSVMARSGIFIDSLRVFIYEYSLICELWIYSWNGTSK